MAFSSYNDYLNKVTNNGQISTRTWQKMLGNVGAFTAGRWYNMAYMQGLPTSSRPGERLINGQLNLGNPQTLSLASWYLGSTFWNWNPNAYTLVRTAGTASNAVALGTRNIFNGGTYGVEIWVQANAASTWQVTLGGVAQTAVTATAGQFHFKIPSTGTADLTITPSGTTTATISNMSVVLFGYGIPLYNTDMGALNIGSAVAPAVKQLLYSGIVSPAVNFVPGTWKLVDMLCAYPVDMTTATSQSLTMVGGNYLTNSGASGNYSTWTVGGDWSYASNQVTFNGTGSSTLSQTVANFSTFGGIGNVPVTIPSAYTYAITYTISSKTGSSAYTVGFAGAITSSVVTTNGTFTQYLTAQNITDGIVFTPSGSGTFVISNISVNVALPRYSNGAGVRAMLCWHSGSYFAATTVPTANAHNISLSYTNTVGTAGQTLPVTVAGTFGAIPIMGAIDNSGVAANNTPGPFMPLAAGDSGVQSVQSFQLSAAAGAYTVGGGTNMYAELILCREIMTLPNMTAYVATERDLMNQVRSLPQIQDGANLQWLFMPGAATAVNTSAHGWLDYVWG